MDSKKKTRLFLCFRPSAIDDDPVKPNRKAGSCYPVLTYIALKGKESTVIPKILTSLSDNSLKVSSDGDVAGAGRKESSRRKISRALKAVLFDTSLATKIRKKKSRQNSHRSNSSVSAIIEKTSNAMNEKDSYMESAAAADDILRTISSDSSLFSSSTAASTSLCSSLSSSINSNPRSLSERKGSFRANSDIESKQPQHQTLTKKFNGYYSSHIGLCLLLISLLVLIFWGKVCAIFCTSTWLFFAPRRMYGADSPVLAVDSPDLDSEEYKKKVIMEGMLDRNRNRVP